MQSSTPINIEREMREKITNFFNNIPDFFTPNRIAHVKYSFDNQVQPLVEICRHIGTLHIEKDQRKLGYDWFRLACKAGSAMGMWNLANYLETSNEPAEVEEAIALYRQSWPLWETGRDRTDIIEKLSAHKDKYPSASMALIQCHYDRFMKHGHKDADRNAFLLEIEYLEKQHPQQAKEFDSKSLQDSVNLRKEFIEEKRTKPRPRPRKFRFTDQEITNSTGRLYIRGTQKNRPF